MSNLRLAAFGLGIGALVWTELQPERGGLALALFAGTVLAFIALVVVHGRLKQRERWAAEMAAVNDEARARLARDWDRLPEVPVSGPRDHPFAHDLDIFGHGSLARFLATTGTGVGRDRLHDWLLAPAPADEVRTRQEAVRELVPALEYRQTIQVSGRLAGDPEPGAIDAFLEWAESGPWLLRRAVLLWTARLLPLATLVLAALQIEGTLVRPWWILTLVASTALLGGFAKRVHREMAGASIGEAGMRHYAGLVGRIQTEDFESGTLRRIRDGLTVECDARGELEKLGWLTELAELRHGGIFYVLVAIPTLWDFHVLWALERWKRRAGRHVRQWADDIARMDALCALAGPVHDEPGWSFPEIVHGDRFTARDLAHPLLGPEERVANDVEVGPPGTFLMVTGSNMSGKSTLLRAIGVNAVLAEAGGPVCAASLRFPPLDLRTSMRVEDSLQRGVSLFMAELQQLKRVVDAADALGSAAPDAGAGDTGRLLLYLLDEVLHGTNSAERQVAIREVLGHLLDRRAIGAISTHDLALADAEPLASAVVPVHFRETVHPEGHEPAMTFDYRLRDGVATSTNALKLVRLVGLA
ncbi:MAG: MutS-related protein [Candidatus Longimicrobiales bacterium M2_2A_002]